VPFVVSAVPFNTVKTPQSTSENESRNVALFSLELDVIKIDQNRYTFN